MRVASRECVAAEDAEKYDVEVNQCLDETQLAEIFAQEMAEGGQGMPINPVRFKH